MNRYKIVHDYERDNGECGTEYIEVCKGLKAAQQRLKEIAEELEKGWQEKFGYECEKEEKKLYITLFKKDHYCHHYEKFMIW
jgi:hypothetical protein